MGQVATMSGFQSLRRIGGEASRGQQAAGDWEVGGWVRGREEEEEGEVVEEEEEEWEEEEGRWEWKSRKIEGRGGEVGRVEERV